jgi:hypothetical protein
MYMNTTIQKLVLPFLAIVSCEPLARADVTAYNIFKTAVFQQTNATPPVWVNSPDAYFFGAQLFSSETGEYVTNATVTAPDSAVYPMPGNPAPTYFNYGSDYYPDETSMDAAFPGGPYTFYVNDQTDSGGLNYPVEELYPTVIPCFTGDTWCRLQAVDPARPLNIYWNNFIPDSGAQSAYVFLNIYNPSGNNVFGTNFLPFEQTNAAVPAYTLNAGTTYQLQIKFSDRVVVNSGFSSSAAGTAGFDYETFTSLITVAPLLCIAPGTNAAVLSWSVAASNFALESPVVFPPLRCGVRSQTLRR